MTRRGPRRHRQTRWRVTLAYRLPGCHTEYLWAVEYHPTKDAARARIERAYRDPSWLPPQAIPLVEVDRCTVEVGS